MSKAIFTSCFLIGISFICFSQENTYNCNDLLFEYEILVDSVCSIAKDYKDDPQNTEKNSTVRFVTTNRNINSWYKKWNASACKEIEEYKLKYDILNRRKKDALKERYTY